MLTAWLALSLIARADSRPVTRAAEVLGFEAIADLEFAPRSTRVEATGVTDDAIAACGHTPARVVILSWGDREASGAFGVDARLAARRLASLARWWRRSGLPRPRTLDLVNMASRRAHPLRPGSRRNDPGPRDVKRTLVAEGAAPRTPLELGLFGEFSRKHRASIWLDCPHVSHHGPVTATGARLAIRHASGGPRA